MRLRNILDREVIRLDQSYLNGLTPNITSCVSSSEPITRKEIYVDLKCVFDVKLIKSYNFSAHPKNPKNKILKYHNTCALLDITIFSADGDFKLKFSIRIFFDQHWTTHRLKNKIRRYERILTPGTIFNVRTKVRFCFKVIVRI